ncbi:MAG: hypothetical protein AAFV32_05050, partial [Myxococcota bacterium]
TAFQFGFVDSAKTEIAIETGARATPLFKTLSLHGSIRTSSASVKVSTPVRWARASVSPTTEVGAMAKA